MNEDVSHCRESILLRNISKSGRIIEVGAGYSPLAPKSEGWNTTVVDHAPQEVLLEKYKDNALLTNGIEKVDFIWHEGSLADIFPKELHGTYDAILASHVGEHLPDFLRFLQASDQLLNESGTLVLALPDKRNCFDIFQPTTMTGDILDAYAKKKTRHSKGAFFNSFAYLVNDNGIGGWGAGCKPNIQLTNSLDTAFSIFNHIDPDPEAEYVDCHTWYFTPASFELIILELNYLGLIPWTATVEQAPTVEFYAWLRKEPIDKSNDITLKRLQILKKMILEKQEEINLISNSASAPRRNVDEIIDENKSEIERFIGIILQNS